MTESITNVELFGFIKIIGVFFMAAIAIIGLGQGLLGFFIWKNNKHEISISKKDLQDEKDRINTWFEETKNSFHGDVREVREDGAREFSHSLHTNILEYLVRSNSTDSDSVFSSLSAIYNTATNRDLALLKRVAGLDLDAQTFRLLTDIVELCEGMR